MGTHLTALLQLSEIIIVAAVGGTDRDVIGFDAEILQALLHVYAHRGPSSPHSDDEVGPVSALLDLYREPVGILE